MKIFNSLNYFKNSDTKFIFQVGGSGELSGSKVENTSTPVVSSTETQAENVQALYEQIRGQIKPEEISNETQQKLFTEFTRFDGLEKSSDFEISQNNAQIATHTNTKKAFSDQRQQLMESNDSEAESNIILGLMPNSHEDFVAYVKNNRPDAEGIRSFLASDELEEIPQAKIEEVSNLATQMVAKMNKIDELSKKIDEEQSQIESLQALNQAKETKKEENRSKAKDTFQGIMDANVPPETEENSEERSVSYLDRHSEIPEMAAPETGVNLMENTPGGDDAEILGLPQLPNMEAEKLDQANEALAQNNEVISDLVSDIRISDTAKEKLLSNIRNLEFFPEATEQQIASIVLAGVDGLSVEEITSPGNPFYSALKTQIDLIRAKHEATAEHEEHLKRETLRKISIVTEAMYNDEELFKYALDDQTYNDFNELHANLSCGDYDKINFTNSLALIDRAITQIENTDFSGNEFHQLLTPEQRTRFAQSKRDYLSTFDQARNEIISAQTRILKAEERAADAAKTRERIQSEIDSYTTTPGKREAAQSIFDSQSFQKNGEVSAPVASFLTNPNSDFSPENIQRVVNLLNSDEYVNASEEEKENLFTNSDINLTTDNRNLNLDQLSAEDRATAQEFIGALPEGASNSRLLENGNIAYEASGVEIEVDIANNKMFPRSADGRSRTWLSMEANPINTPAIQFFSAAMGASVDDKEDGFASIMRGGGQWKNEIFWRNLLAPTTGRSLQHKEIAGIKAIENAVGIQRLMTHLDLIDESGNFVPGNAAEKRDEFFKILTSAANGSFETFAEKPAGTPLTELPE